MKNTANAHKSAVELGIAEEKALKKGVEEKSRKFTEKSSELNAET